MPIIHRMHRNGIYLDRGKLATLDQKLREDSEYLRYQIEEEVGHPINPGSPDQVAEFLFGEIGLPIPSGVKLTKSGKRPSVDDDCLSALAGQHPVVDLIQSLRGVDKLRGTYTGPEAMGSLVQSDERLHTTFRTTVARTGRLASEEPNLMNIPTRSEDGRKVRDCFTTDPRFRAAGKPTVLASLDLSQIEMVWAAHLSQDPTMMEVFRKKQDIHLKTVCGVNTANHGSPRPGVVLYDYDATEPVWGAYKAGTASPEDTALMRELEMGQRLRLKSVGFGVLFGQTPPGLQVSILGNGGGLVPLSSCEQYILDWFDLYSGVEVWMSDQRSRVQRYGMVWDQFGRVRLIPGAKSALAGISSKALREAGNHPIQAGAQGTIKVAMAEVEPLVQMFESCWPEEICLPLLQIHDELIFELSLPIVDEFTGTAKEIMETAVPLTVPTRSSKSTGNTWMELK
jgi:DNA polymerase-1